jgi:hypothetical protein
MACGGVAGEYDYEVYKKFADQVGWRRSGNWLGYDELTFSVGKGSKHAHLPFDTYRNRIESSRFSRAATCNL